MKERFTAICKYARELWSWRIACWWFDVWHKIAHFCRSRKECPDCGHQSRDHYKSDPYNGERGCIVAWPCGGPEYTEWDGCSCKWSGWGPLPRYCKCGEPEYEHEDGVTWNCKGFEEKKSA